MLCPTTTRDNFPCTNIFFVPLLVKVRNLASNLLWECVNSLVCNGWGPNAVHGERISRPHPVKCNGC